jgi:hypothetical protein
MFTPDSLLEIALQQQAIVDANPQTPGTINDINYEARKLRDKALAAGSWMQEHGIARLEHVGEFTSFEVAKGQTVRLRRGAIVYSTNPQVPREGKTNKLNRNIRAHHVIRGYVDICGMADTAVRNVSINWAGAGCYWYWTDINNVEIV